MLNLGLAGCAVKLDMATPAAVDYLTTGNLKSWDNLLGICYKFIGNLFVKDQFGDFIVEGPQHDELTGKRNLYHRRREGTVDLTRQWIAEWLFGRFNRYAGKSSAEIQEAADRGEFRYLGTQCRSSLIDKLRTTDLEPVHFVHLDADDATAEGTSVGAGGGTLSNSIGTWNTGGQSSLHSPSVCREDLIEFIAENKVLLADVMIELMAYIDCFFPEDGITGTKGGITRTIGDNRDVRATQARAYKRRFLNQARGASNPALRDLFKLLQPESPIIFVPESKENQSKRWLKAQALGDMRDFEEWCRANGVAPGNAVIDLQEMAKMRGALTPQEKRLN
jgi:hypothetical protein